jgi:small-conductance mechanosensitive channel
MEEVLDWGIFIGSTRTYLTTELFKIGDDSVTVITLITFAVILVVTLISSRLIQRAIRKMLDGSEFAQSGALGNGLRLVHYAVLLIGAGIGLSTVGIDLKAVFAAGAIFAFAIGFAMQSIAQNFVSGIILLIERTIKVGDILEVEGEIVKVTHLGFRATTARTRDETELLIPNSTLVGSTVKNYTHQDSIFRLRVPIGVAYDTDIPFAMETLKSAGENLTWGLKGREPRVLLLDFADSAIILELSVWINNPWKSRFYYSDLRVLVWKALKDTEVTIAFPQLDVHFDPGIGGRLAREPGVARTTN